MSGKPVEVELETMFKQQIRQVQKRLEALNRLEAEDVELDKACLDVYAEQRELRAYINHYRIALEQLKRYGRYRLWASC